MVGLVEIERNKIWGGSLEYRNLENYYYFIFLYPFEDGNQGIEEIEKETHSNL